ncbi:MAG: glycosyltransferase family 2 protein, partial [Verrucomicrobiales bacterium]|nr:glycosyltransferase family 2 protein [Verrucomicrobiales bacterium]
APFFSGTMVLIPALNEAETIATTIDFWKSIGAAHIRVVDNGSTDETGRVAAEADAEVKFEPHRGYGAAAWRGLQDVPAQIEWILFSSADGSDRLSQEEVNAFQEQIQKGADLLLGDRFAQPESRLHLKLVQSFGNRLCCWLIYLGWRKRFNDLGSLRLIRRSALEKLQLRDRSFGWNVEMQVRAIEHRLRIVEIPVRYYPRQAGRSKISGSWLGTFKAGWGILKMIGKLWWTKTS